MIEIECFLIQIELKVLSIVKKWGGLKTVLSNTYHPITWYEYHQIVQVPD